MPKVTVHIHCNIRNEAELVKRIQRELVAAHRSTPKRTWRRRLALWLLSYEPPRPPGAGTRRPRFN